LTDWPGFVNESINDNLVKEMQDGREVASIILMRRKTNSVKVRMPLKKFHYQGPRELTQDIKKVVSEEGNVQNLIYDGNAGDWLGDNQDDFRPENFDVNAGQARDIVRSIQEERKNLGTTMDEKVNVTLPDWPGEFEDYIKKNALVDELSRGEELKVSRRNS
jgi:hypothetical protein